MSTTSAAPTDPLRQRQLGAQPVGNPPAGKRGASRGPGPTRCAAVRRRDDVHVMAVKRSLGWAQESADEHDYKNALGWLGVLEAIGEQLPAEYQTRRQEWAHALAGAEPSREVRR